MIHFDHAATGLPRLDVALEAARHAATLPTPGRGRHGPQAEAAKLLEASRLSVGKLVGGPHHVCFSPGVTAALNQAITGLRPRPRRVALGPLLHNAAARPCAALGVPTWTLPHDANGRVDLERTEGEWREETDALVVSHGSNVTGLVQPVRALVTLAQGRGARVVVDAAQTTGLLDLECLRGADLIALSAHKAVRALPGIGALLVRHGVRLEPLVRGGVGFDAAAPDVPDELPHRLESGTPNLPAIAAFGAAIEASDPPTEVALAALTAALREAVEGAGVTLLGEGTLPVVSAQVHDPRGLEDALDRVYGITSRAGLHCAPAAHQALGSSHSGTLRISAGTGTTEVEMAALRVALTNLLPALAPTSAER